MAIQNKDDEIIEILKLIAPGTELRQGLDNVLKSKTGALIVVGDTTEVEDYLTGNPKIVEQEEATLVEEVF